MVVFFAFMVVAITCILVVLKQLFEAAFFIIEQRTILQNENICAPESKCILKKTGVFQLSIKIKKRIIQSRCFHAKFLFTDKYLHVSMSTKCLIEKIYSRVANNLPLFKESINYSKLQNAGMFACKPIFKINLKDIKGIDEILFALREVFKRVDFRTIFLLYGNEADLIKSKILEKQIDFDYKLLFYEDVNLTILQELNKIDLNYLSHTQPMDNLLDDVSVMGQSIEWNRMNDVEQIGNVSTSQVDVYSRRLLNIGLCVDRLNYSFELKNKEQNNKQVKIILYYKLNSFFFNIEKNKKYLYIKFFDGNKDEYFYFSHDTFNYELIRKDNKTFLKFIFKINILKNNKIFLSLINTGEKIYFDNIKQYKMISYFNTRKNIEKILNIKIFTKNNWFNNWFNRILKQKVIDEKFNINKYKNNILINNKDIIKLCQFLKCDYRFLVGMKNYFSLYEFVVKEIFGLHICNNLLHVGATKVDFGFKVCILFEGKMLNVFAEPNEKRGIEIEGVYYENVGTIDLNLVREKLVKVKYNKVG